MWNPACAPLFFSNFSLFYCYFSLSIATLSIFGSAHWTLKTVLNVVTNSEHHHWAHCSSLTDTDGKVSIRQSAWWQSVHSDIRCFLGTCPLFIYESNSYWCLGSCTSFLQCFSDDRICVWIIQAVSHQWLPTALRHLRLWSDWRLQTFGSQIQRLVPLNIVEDWMKGWGTFVLIYYLPKVILDFVLTRRLDEEAWGSSSAFVEGVVALVARDWVTLADEGLHCVLVMPVGVGWLMLLRAAWDFVAPLLGTGIPFVLVEAAGIEGLSPVFVLSTGWGPERMGPTAGRGFPIVRGVASGSSSSIRVTPLPFFFDVNRVTSSRLAELFVLWTLALELSSLAVRVCVLIEEIGRVVCWQPPGLNGGGWWSGQS